MTPSINFLTFCLLLSPRLLIDSNAAESALQTPVSARLTIPGQPLFDYDFTTKQLPEKVNVRHGTHQSIEGGVITVTSTTREEQAKARASGVQGHVGVNPSLGVEVDFHDAIVRFDFKLDEPGEILFVANNPTLSHLFNVVIAPDKITFIKQRDKKDKTSKDLLIGELAIRLESNASLARLGWHRVEIEFCGPDVLVTVDDQPSLFVSDTRFDIAKSSLTIRTAKLDVMHLDNITAFGATRNPAWHPPLK